MNMLPHVVPTVLDLLSIVICIGILSLELWVIPEDEILLRHRLWRSLGLALAGLTLMSIIGLLQRTMEMSDLPLTEIFSTMPLVLSETHFGMIWLIRIAAVTALWLAWGQGGMRDSRLLAWIMILAAACVVWSVSASSHAADWGDFTLPEWITWLHIMAGSIWVGSILAFVLILWSQLRESPNQKIFSSYATHLSRLAGVMFVFVLCTGAYNLWLQIDKVEYLWVSSYGRIILLKIFVVGAMVALGASNRYLSLPKLTQELLHIRVFIWRLKLEAYLALGALVCAALLGHAMPPKKHTDAVGKLTIIAGAKPVTTPIAREIRFRFSIRSTSPVKRGILKYVGDSA